MDGDVSVELERVQFDEFAIQFANRRSQWRSHKLIIQLSTSSIHSKAYLLFTFHSLNWAEGKKAQVH